MLITWSRYNRVLTASAKDWSICPELDHRSGLHYYGIRLCHGAGWCSSVTGVVLLNYCSRDQRFFKIATICLKKGGILLWKLLLFSSRNNRCQTWLFEVQFSIIDWDWTETLHIIISRYNSQYNEQIGRNATSFTSLINTLSLEPSN